MKDMHSKKRGGPQFAKDNAHAGKLTESDVDDAVELRMRGYTCKAIGRRLGVTGACIATATRKRGNETLS